MNKDMCVVCDDGFLNIRAGAIIMKAGKLLMVSNDRDYLYSVGGRLKFGETAEEAVVREVLEEKLSVILKEMGVDKYSDVLDSEVAECDFTDVYMRSIGHASRVEKSLYPVAVDENRQNPLSALLCRDRQFPKHKITFLIWEAIDLDRHERCCSVLHQFCLQMSSDFFICNADTINQT